MKKLSIAILALLVAGGAYIPKYLGQGIDERLHEELALYNTLTAENYALVKYDRGWFGSTAVLQVSGYDGQIPYTLAFDVAIDHGPRGLAWELGSSVATLRSVEVGGSNYESEVREFFGDAEPLIVESHYLPSGETELQFAIAPINGFEIPGSVGAVVSWGGVSGHVVNGLHFDTVSVDVDFEPFEVAGPKGEFRLANSRLYGDFERRGKLLYVGKEALEIGSITFSGQMMPVELRNLVIGFAIAEEGGLVNIGMDVGLESLTVGGMPLPSWDASVSFNHIGMASLEGLAGKFIEYGRYPQGPDEALALIMGDSGLRNDLEQILASEPELVVELSRFESMLGQMEGKVVANVQGPVDDVFNNPEQLLGNLRASMELVMDGAVLDVILSGASTRMQQFMTRKDYDRKGSPMPGGMVPGPEELKAILVAAGVLVKEGQRYRIEAAWSREGATINGEPVERIEEIIRSRIEQ